MENQTIENNVYTMTSDSDPNIKIIENPCKGIVRIIHRYSNTVSAQEIAREIALSEFDKRIK